MEGPCAAVPEPLVAYRQHATNMIVADPDASIHEFDRLPRNHAERGQYQLALDGVGDSYWVASGQRRAGHGWAAADPPRRSIRYPNVGHLGSAVRSPLGEWAVGLARRRRLCASPTGVARRALGHDLGDR